MSQTRDVSIERLADDGGRTSDRDTIVVEEPLQLRARGTPVATIMRTPGHDLELVRGLLHAEGVAAGVLAGARSATGDFASARGDVARSASPSRSGAITIVQAAADAIDIDVDPNAFAGRGLLASAACGVCGRVAIADLELRAREVTSDVVIDRAVIAGLPDALRAAQGVFAQTGGLHAAGIFEIATGEMLCVREDVGRHNAVDKVAGWALNGGIATTNIGLVLSGRAGYELVQKAIVLGVPVVCSVSAPSSLAVELAERFGVGLVGFVRGKRANIYAHGWRVRG